MSKGIGLCGSHRTGKTTLAHDIAAKTGTEFLQTATGEVFALNGLHPSESMDFATRIWIQHKVVDAAEKVWQRASAPFVSDRTPIDMMAYTLADIQGKTSVDFAALEDYLHHCFEVTNLFFSRLVVVQPAIPLVHEEGKAALNKAYMEHLNILIKGLCSDERLQLPVLVLARNVVDREQRVEEVMRESEQET